MSDLRRAVHEEIEAHRPVVIPPFGEVLDRKRSRDRRNVAAVAAVAMAAVTIVLGTALLPNSGRDRVLPAEPSPQLFTGPPRVAVFVEAERPETYVWQDGFPEKLPHGPDSTTRPLAMLPEGFLLLETPSHGLTHGLTLLRPDKKKPDMLWEYAEEQVVLRADGQRAVYVSTGDRPQVQEVVLPSGAFTRDLFIDEVFGDNMTVEVVGYSGEDIVLNVSEDNIGAPKTAVVWQTGDARVIRPLYGYEQALGSTMGWAAISAAAEQKCAIDIVNLATGKAAWKLCGTFIAFSPDGRSVLTKNESGDGLTVHDVRSGRILRQLVTHAGFSAGWETGDTVLYAESEGDEAKVMRCAVTSDKCVEAARLPTSEAVIVRPVPSLSREE